MALGNVIKDSGVTAASGKRRGAGFDATTAFVLIVFIAFALGTGALAIYAGNKFLTPEPVASNEFPAVANQFTAASQPVATPTWVPTVSVSDWKPTAQPIFNDVSAVYAGGENGAMSNELADLAVGNTIVVNGVEYAVLEALTNPAMIDMGTAERSGPVCAVDAPNLETLQQNIYNHNVLRCVPYDGWVESGTPDVFTAFMNAGEQVAWSVEVEGNIYCFPYRQADEDGIVRIEMPVSGYIPCGWQY